jgi:preprotein translocase subunit SecD
MNRYPWWKYLILAIALLIGLLYTLPNFFGEAPAVQVSSAKATVKVDARWRRACEQALSQAGQDPARLRAVRRQLGQGALADTDTQLKAKDAIAKALNPDAADPTYIVALNLLSRSPPG